LATLKLQNRLKAVKSLHSILSALQVVTSVQMKKVKQKHLLLEDHLQSAEEVLRGRTPAKKLKNQILVVVTSNRGLCGSFISNVVTKVNTYLKESPNAKVAAIGKRGADRIKKKHPPLFIETNIIDKPDFGSCSKILDKLLGQDAEIIIAVNTYKSTVIQVPKIYKLYPVPEELENLKPERSTDYIFEPSSKELIGSLFMHYIRTKFFQLLINSQMGELAARLMVLKGAVDNSKDLITELVVKINKERQASITEDLSEISGSAEALAKGEFENE